MTNAELIAQFHAARNVIYDDFGGKERQIRRLELEEKARAGNQWKAREELAEMDEEDEQHRGAVDKAFSTLREGLTLSAILAEMEEVTKQAGRVLAGEDIEEPDFTVNLEFLVSETVQKNDVEKAEALSNEVDEMVKSVDAELAKNAELMRAATSRTENDAELSATLADLEERRGRALLAGEDLTELNAEVMSLQERIKANRVAVKLAAGDVAALQAHADKLEPRRNKLKNTAYKCRALAAALRCHSMVTNIHTRMQELADLVLQFKEEADKVRTCDGYIRKVLFDCPYFADKLYLPYMFSSGSTMRPDYRGCMVRIDGMAKNIFRFEY